MVSVGNRYPGTTTAYWVPGTSRSLGRELVDGHLPVLLPGLEDHRRETRLVHRVGEVLRLQAEAGMLLIHHPALALHLAVEEVARIELHARLGRQHLHDAARLGVLDPRR